METNPVIGMIEERPPPSKDPDTVVVTFPKTTPAAPCRNSTNDLRLRASDKAKIQNSLTRPQPS